MNDKKQSEEDPDELFDYFAPKQKVKKNVGGPWVNSLSSNKHDPWRSIKENNNFLKLTKPKELTEKERD